VWDLCALRNAPCDNKCFYCTILSLAEQMFLLYHFVPCGTNVFIVPLCALRNKKLETCDPEGVRCGICAHCGTNVFIVPLCALRPKMLETCDPWDRFFLFPDPGGVTRLLPLCALRNKCFYCTIVGLAA
jgi:hypothetical protein